MYLDKVIVDDGYMQDVSEYFESQGKQLQEIIDSYIRIMNRVAEEGISKGQTSDSIRRFISYAEQLNNVIADTSIEIKTVTMNCMEEIDTQDRYIF